MAARCRCRRNSPPRCWRRWPMPPAPRARLPCRPRSPALRPLLAAQQRASALPVPEHGARRAPRPRQGHHLYVYPFAGRQSPRAGTLWAWRYARGCRGRCRCPSTTTGWSCSSDEPRRPRGAAHAARHRRPALRRPAQHQRRAASMRRFREIARVSGLVFPGFPGANKSAKQLPGVEQPRSSRCSGNTIHRTCC